MGEQTKDERDYGAKPMHRLTEAERNENDFQWFKDCANYFIAYSAFNVLNNVNSSQSESKNYTKEWTKLVELYHNEINPEWFDSVTNPLKTANKQFLDIGARLRSLNILRPTIDFLHSNFAKRNFNWSVVNEDKDVYNSYFEKEKEFILNKLVTRMAQLITNPQEGANPMDLIPEQLKETFKLSYRDEIADKYQKRLANSLDRTRALEVFGDCFLDYLIGGEAVTHKEIRNGRTHVRRVDRRLVEFDKNLNDKYGEKAEWFVEVELVSSSDIYERYDLTPDEMIEVDQMTTLSSESLKGFLEFEGVTDMKRYTNRIPIYHTLWRGRKKVIKIKYYDEDGFLQEETVPEDYVIDETTEEAEITYVNTLFKVDRIGTKIYKKIGEETDLVYPPDDYDKPLMPYNTIRFSHYNNKKIFSPLSIGVPILIMYITCNFLAEKMLAKHKGKMLLMDANAIPKRKGWNEELFIYYAEKLGYVFVDRSQDDVDKSFNQYQTVEISTLQDVSVLLETANFYRRLWDDVISIPPQMRGQSFSTDEVGTTKAAIFQSGISIDYIYQKFDGFMGRDFGYLLELERLVTLRGDYTSSYLRDDGLIEYFEINQQDTLSKIGVRISNNARENQELEESKAYAKSVNQQDPASVIEIISARSMTSLKKTLLTLSERNQQRQMQLQESENEAKREALEFEKELQKAQGLIDMMLQDNEYANKGELLEKEITLQGGESSGADKDKDGVPDYTEAIMKHNVDMEKVAIDKEKNRISEKLGLEKIKADKAKNRSKTK